MYRWSWLCSSRQIRYQFCDSCANCIPHVFQNGFHEKRGHVAVTAFQYGPSKNRSCRSFVNQGDWQSSEERKLTEYCQTISYLLASYETDNVIAEVEAEITIFKQTEPLSAVKYFEVLLDEVLYCGRVYEEPLINRALIKRLHVLVRLPRKSTGKHIRMRCSETNV